MRTPVQTRESKWVFKGITDNPYIKERGQLTAQFSVCTFLGDVEQKRDLSDVSQPKQFFTAAELLKMRIQPPYQLALQFGLSAALVETATIGMNAFRVDAALAKLDAIPVQPAAAPKPALSLAA